MNYEFFLYLSETKEIKKPQSNVSLRRDFLLKLYEIKYFYNLIFYGLLLNYRGLMPHPPFIFYNFWMLWDKTIDYELSLSLKLLDANFGKFLLNYI